jgi:hypothetical protein
VSTPSYPGESHIRPFSQNLLGGNGKTMLEAIKLIAKQICKTISELRIPAKKPQKSRGNNKD